MGEESLSQGGIEPLYATDVAGHLGGTLVEASLEFVEDGGVRGYGGYNRGTRNKNYKSIIYRIVLFKLYNNDSLHTSFNTFNHETHLATFSFKIQEASRAIFQHK